MRGEVRDKWVIPWAVRKELDSTPQICVQFIIFA